MRYLASAIVAITLISLAHAGEKPHYNLRYVKEFSSVNKFKLASGHGGKIEGKVLYTGKRELKNKRKLITKDKEVCGRGYKIDEVYVIGKSGGVKNAVVFLEGMSERRTKTEVKLIQERCEFSPRVVALTKGSNLKIVNADSVKHEANGVQDFETIFQLSQPNKGMEHSVKLEKAGVVEITCNIHGWMKAWAVVIENDFYAVTDESGKFSISNVPPGEYTLRVWHEGFGEKRLKVRVSEGKTSTLSVEFK